MAGSITFGTLTGALLTGSISARCFVIATTIGSSFAGDRGSGMITYFTDVGSNSDS